MPGTFDVGGYFLTSGSLKEYNYLNNNGYGYIALSLAGLLHLITSISQVKYFCFGVLPTL